jgi:TDG/mug DNA glycosylase family protein
MASRQAAGRLPDYLQPGLDLVFVGINPGRHSAREGHHYAGPGNHFWPLLYEAGLIPDPMTYKDDARVPNFGIGLTNIVARPTRGIEELTLAEMQAGARRLRAKLRRFAPAVVCFNGKQIYEVFTGRRCVLGEQADAAEGAKVFVMPSTSPRTASYQRADKLRFFQQLRRLVAREVAA